jgi:sugar lactone lactonase YvrE
MMVRKVALALALTLLVAAALPTLAQDEASPVIADGLNNPRGIFYAADGTLYIAEAGLSGDLQADSNFGPVSYGLTARVLAVAPEGGEPTVVADALLSSNGFENIIGVNAVYVTNAGMRWLVLGNAPENAVGRKAGVLIIDPDDNVVGFIDLGAYESQNNPDNDFPVSNPSDIDYGQNGNFYVIDASGNTLYTITAEAAINVFHVWEDLPVPTTVAVAPDGSLYVSFLTAFPFDIGGSRIEHWSASGELIETFEGLSLVTDVLVGDDGTVYAVEFATDFGDQGYEPDSGAVVTVSAAGITPLAEGLNYPYGLAMSPDGTLVVSINSAFVEPGSGAVVTVSGAAAGAVVPEATPEAGVEAPEATPEATPEASAGGDVEEPAETPEVSS